MGRIDRMLFVAFGALFLSTFGIMVALDGISISQALLVASASTAGAAAVRYLGEDPEYDPR